MNKKLSIAILLPDLYMTSEVLAQTIFAPSALGVNLADGLVDRGHDVTLFTISGTKSKARIVHENKNWFLEELRNSKLGFLEYLAQHKDRFEEYRKLSEQIITFKAFQMARRNTFDIIHSFHNTLFMNMAPLLEAPSVFTLHDPLPRGQTGNSVNEYVLHEFSRNNFITVSKSQQKGMPELHYVGAVYNGINLDDFPFNPAPQNNLLYFGRFMKQKGAHVAIQVAKKMNMDIDIAGKYNPLKPSDYFLEEIKPHVDSKHVRLHGMIHKKERSCLIGNAKVFLFPITREEPFGLVMTEAMACGTPVIAFRRGSVPEIVKHGKTGFVVDTVDEMVEAVKKIDTIDRAACRKRVEDLFSVEKMVQGYEEVYTTIIDQRRKAHE